MVQTKVNKEAVVNPSLGTLTNISTAYLHVLVNTVIVKGTKTYIPSTVSNGLFQLMAIKIHRNPWGYSINTDI